ncbi:flagellar biosynthesis protein FlhF [[Clostridium] polysaccharolyticum]|uniref:Flagellar biosynthesis protein FlhF n=1 Tax=[Clostridium] polysaccharolyticum TaxID=29364 RepID=A0A1H9Y2M1_9FIRM|nr:flagellar biosynthesis protein FlhF [[Clostridium] polysaccharolyticum]SES63080.1 flagellar biosynthesis protein FlhF [[Clostridium] polysaccharolyticum]
MIIKKYEAETEKEAILLAKSELGKDAIVMNIKTVKPKGIYRFFRKSTVEITAAVDENGKKAEEKKEQTVLTKGFGLTQGETEKETDEAGFRLEIKETAIEKRLDNLQDLLEKQLSTQNVEEDKQEELTQNEEYLLLIFNQLVENEVDEIYAKQIIDEIKKSLKKDAPVDHILTNVYQKLVLKLGEPKFIDLQNKEKKFIFFIGPTGVGKTTTIAKIASNLKLKENAKTALITSDTYRIAAVEQLRTYASILDIPLSVVYTKEELEQEKDKYQDYDVVLIDTAGRSHRNEEQKKDLLELIDTVDEECREVFLVLSATTKYKDLIRITETYRIIDDFGIIFTKLDETTCIGNILNVKLMTNAPLSYTTWGQNVPDDFGCMDAQSIAKKLLGGNR